MSDKADHLAQNRPSSSDKYRFIDLFAGLGGFHVGLSRLGHECVFACEIDSDLAKLYKKNFDLVPQGDIKSISEKAVPEHDILCAGFPCQPFSLAGKKRGAACPKSGRLIEDVFRIATYHRPKYIFLENVPNVLTIANGSFWRGIQRDFDKLSYQVSYRIYSPTEFGIPQPRKRLFVVGVRKGVACPTLPLPAKMHERSFLEFVSEQALDSKPLEEEKIEILNVWNELVSHITTLTSRTIIANEFGATYPLDGLPKNKKWRSYRGSFGEMLDSVNSRSAAFGLLPHYVDENGVVPEWMIPDIEYSRALYKTSEKFFDQWKAALRDKPNSWQKFEWRGHRNVRNVWGHTIQFRASGIRIMRPEAVPSLIAMTPTQTPIIGHKKRYLGVREAASLQALEDLKFLPETPSKAFKALGNAVNSLVVESLARAVLAPT